MDDTQTLPEAGYRLERYWGKGIPWDRYFRAEIREHRELWEGVYRNTEIPEWALERLACIGREWRLLILAEDWCGDASNLVPIFARLGERAPEIEVRILKRNENPELMDRYLTHGSRSIPLVIVVDERGEPRGRWGPRPSELQEYVTREKQSGSLPASEIYKEVRRWYARDRGETTLREFLELLEAFD